MFEIYVFTETEITNEDLRTFVRDQNGSVAPDGLSFALEDKAHGLAAILDMCDDPEYPERMRIMSQKSGQKLSSAVAISVVKRSFEFSLSVASLLVKQWGGLAYVHNVDLGTLKLAERHNLPLWIERERGSGVPDALAQEGPGAGRLGAREGSVPGTG